MHTTVCLDSGDRPLTCKFLSLNKCKQYENNIDSQMAINMWHALQYIQSHLWAKIDGDSVMKLTSNANISIIYRDFYDMHVAYYC